MIFRLSLLIYQHFYPGFEHTKKHGITLILAGTLKSTYLNTALNISLPTRNHKKGSILGLETAIFELPAMETTVADFSECDKVVYINIKIETLQTLQGNNDRIPKILKNISKMKSLGFCKKIVSEL